MKTSLLALTREYHEYLGELFLLHQEALLERDTQLALQALDLFAQMLAVHMAVEEELFFAAHERLAQRRWQADLYEKEHRKIEVMLVKARRQVEAWGQGSGGRRELIAILDDQRALKNVLEHHEQREEIALLAELDGQLSSAELAALISVASERWDALRNEQQAELGKLQGRLA